MTRLAAARRTRSIARSLGGPDVRCSTRSCRSRPPRHGRDPARHLLAVHHWGRAARERIADECKRREGLMRSSGVVRLGILGPGYIATRFMRNASEAAKAEVVAVGSRTLSLIH